MRKIFFILAICFFIPCMASMLYFKEVLAAESSTDVSDVTNIICNIIEFTQKIGLPIMTGVIVGSSIMAIFGRLAWPAIVVLVVFTAIFFGASKVMKVFVGSTAADALGTSKCVK